MAEIAYQRGGVADGGEGIELCHRLANTLPLATELACLAWIRHAVGDRRGALEAVGEAVRVASNAQRDQSATPFPPGGRGCWWLMDLPAAREQNRRRGLRVDTIPTIRSLPAVAARATRPASPRPIALAAGVARERYKTS